MKHNSRQNIDNNRVDCTLSRPLRPLKSRTKLNRCADATNYMKCTKKGSSSRRILSMVDLNNSQSLGGTWIFEIGANKSKENSDSDRSNSQRRESKRLQSIKKNSTGTRENQNPTSTLNKKSLQNCYPKKRVEPTPKIKDIKVPSLLVDAGSLNHMRFIDAQLNGQSISAYIDVTSECVTLRRREADILKLKIQQKSNRNLLGYGDTCIRPIGICTVKLRLDLVEAEVQVYVVADEEQGVSMIVGQSFTDRPDVTVIQRNGKLRILESSVLDLDRLPMKKNLDEKRLLSLSSLLNQLQPNVRWNSSLKIQDREIIQPERTFKYADLSVRLAAPGQLQPKPNVSDLAFGKYFTDHMLKIYYHEALGGWQIPEITPLENLVLHPAAKVLHYAIELFEGMKAYRGIDGKIRVFRPEMNMERMNASAVRSGLPTFNGNELIKCINRLISIDQEWVPHSEASSLYIRPTLIGIDPTLGVAASDSALLYVILSPAGSYFAKSGNSNRGVSLLADPRYTRAWPGGCGDRKMGSNYGPTLHVQREAAEKGCQQVLWLYGDEHQLTEVGTMNIFMYFINDEGEKELVTPPLSGLILPGITRNSILSLAREWNQFKVTERIITMPEVLQLLSENRMLELFGAGTAAVVSPISHIYYVDQHLYLPTVDQVDPIHRVFHKHLADIQYGYVEHPWAFPIE